MSVQFKDGSTTWELACTACHAALELDLESRGETVERIAICCVAKWLREEIANTSGDFMDPSMNYASIMLLEHTLKDWGCEVPHSTVDDVRRIARETATALCATSKDNDAEPLICFCLSLSRMADVMDSQREWLGR